MSHEIYYTSAPEGIKRGSGGFCTVAASENLPKALWDRLETLSAYRHHFSVNDSGGNGAAGGANPVSHAHSILSVTGKSYHVLSRICDSGVDHTQRTNAFAHHLVVEAAEMEAAAGGPAWLLKHFGVMRQAWDGQVGNLGPRNLPRGDSSGSKICSAWEALTGDAGWGGHLADLFVKAPTRPVCILFEPGQELLTLMAESLALLPPAARWNVTFNTYFTSMPTSATCLWRCCVAGTPAGQLGLRYAANGLILDLTSRQRLGSVPPGPLVTVARTGQSTIGLRPAAAAPAGGRPKSVVIPAAKAPAKTGAVDPEGDLEEAELERQRAAILEIAPEGGGEIPLAELPQEGVLPEDLAHAARQESRPTGDGRRPVLKKPRVAIGAKAAKAEADWDQAAARRRRQVMLLFGGALLTMAVGTGLVYLAAKRNSLPEDVGTSGKSSSGNADGTTVKPPQPVEEEIAPHGRDERGGHVPERIDVRGGGEPLDNGNTVKPEIPPPGRTVVVPAAPVYADLISPTAMLEKPNVGNGMGERFQGLPLRMAEVDHVANVTGLRLAWPARVNGMGSAGGNGAATGEGNGEGTFSNDGLGVLSTAAETRNGKPGVAVRFKPRGEPAAAPPAEVVFIGFDRARPGVDLAWRSAMLLKYPELFSFVYWMLQNSTLEMQGGRTPAQKIAFKRVEMPAMSVAAASAVIPWPVDLPRETTVIPPKITQLPGGWEATWYTAWDETDTSKRTAANAMQVIRFKKPTISPVTEAWFLLTFKGSPGHGTVARVESTFARRQASDMADKERYDGEVRAVYSQIDEAKAHAIGGVLPDIDSTRELYARRDATTQLATGFEQAVAAYRELKEFELQFQCDGVTLTTVRFQQDDKAGK